MADLRTNSKDKSTIISYCSRSGQHYKVLGYGLDEDFAVVLLTQDNGWILILRKYGVIIHECASIEACLYLAKLLRASDADLNCNVSLNLALREIHRSVTESVSAISGIIDGRQEMHDAGSLEGR